MSREHPGSEYEANEAFQQSAGTAALESTEVAAGARAVEEEVNANAAFEKIAEIDKQLESTADPKAKAGLQATKKLMLDFLAQQKKSVQ